MKKKLYTFVCLLLVMALPLAAFAQEEETAMELQGFVTEIVEGGFLMEDAEMGEVMLNTSDATVWDGLLMEDELAVGQYVMVQYDGRMTFSLPPQAHADRVGLHMLSGSITEMYEDGTILMNDETHGEVLVHTEEDLPLYIGMPITVYYDGVMTLSLPSQVSAKHILLPELTGAVSNWSEEGFTLTDEDGNEYEILMNEETIVAMMPQEILENEELLEETSEEMTEEEAEAAEEEVIEEEPAADEEEEVIEEEPAADEEEIIEEETAIEWGDESFVTVYYNGMMTRSIPAQVNALEIRVIE